MVNFVHITIVIHVNFVTRFDTILHEYWTKKLALTFFVVLSNIVGNSLPPKSSHLWSCQITCLSS